MSCAETRLDKAMDTVMDRVTTISLEIEIVHSSLKQLLLARIEPPEIIDDELVDVLCMLSRITGRLKMSLLQSLKEELK